MSFESSTCFLWNLSSFSIIHVTYSSTGLVWWHLVNYLFPDSSREYNLLPQSIAYNGWWFPNHRWSSARGWSPVFRTRWSHSELEVHHWRWRTQIFRRGNSRQSTRKQRASPRYRHTKRQWIWPPRGSEPVCCNCWYCGGNFSPNHHSRNVTISDSVSWKYKILIC